MNLKENSKAWKIYNQENIDNSFLEKTFIENIENKDNSDNLIKEPLLKIERPGRI